MQPVSGVFLVVLPLLLGACAGGPAPDTRRVDRSLTPGVVSAEPGAATGRQVLWGGVILGTTNLPDSTRIELLAYPLDSQEKPQRDDPPQEHFLLEQCGFLDPVIYAEGRLLTITGTILRVDKDPLGVAEQTCPVISAKELHLWPAERMNEAPVIHFGIGVGYGF